MLKYKSIFRDMRHDFFQSPNVVSDTGLHCWPDAQALVNPAKIR
jgi:hypothetical protein